MAATLPSSLGLRGERRHRPPPGGMVLIPALLVAGATLLPIVYLAIRAAGAEEGIWTLLFHQRTIRVLANTLLLAATVTVSATALALPLAWLTTRTDLPGAGIWSVLTALPLAIPSYISGIIVATVFGPAGALRTLFGRLGAGLPPVDIYGFPGAWLTLTLVAYPYVLLSLRAGLRAQDPSLEEASRSLGESGWRSFWRVTMPQLRPWMGAGGVLVALYVLSDFGAVSMMQFESFATAIYLQYKGSFNRESAAVLSLVLVMVAALIVLAAEGRGRARFHRLKGTPRIPTVVRLGRWRWPAVGFCAAVAVVALVVPFGVITYWLAVGLRHGEPLIVALRPALNSLSVSALAAGVTVAAALPLAVLSVRHGGRLATFATRLAYAGFALPGVVLALALVFLGARYLPALYQTLWLLVFAYALHFLPQAAGPLRSALLQVSPSQEEAARTLGRTAPRVLWTVTLPLMRPGIIAAAAIVFLTTMKELPATLLLSPIGFETLATRIWSTATEGFFARAAASALLLLLIASLSMGVLLVQENRRAEA